MLERSIREFNEILHEASESMLRHGLISQPEDDITETEALQYLLISLLDQEVKKQQIQDSRQPTNDPPWIVNLVNDVTIPSPIIRMMVQQEPEDEVSK